MYNEYDHSNVDDIYAACGIDKELVKRVHDKIMTDIKEKECLSEAIALLEESLVDSKTTTKLARPVAVIIVRMMMDEIKREHVMETVSSAMTKLIGTQQGKSISDLDLSKDEVERYAKSVIDRHKQPRDK